jgi:hypothetical protein
VVEVPSVSDSLEPLILDLLEWLDAAPRPYPDVMEAWRTSCPRLPVWEDANDRGFVARQRAGGLEFVTVSPNGRAYLRAHRSVPAS